MNLEFKIERRRKFLSPEYKAWIGMKSRCYAKNGPSYKWYGARGIKVCDRWVHNFNAFHLDIGPRPGPGFSLDRINSNGDYEPGNVRWADDIAQNRNRGVCKKFKARGLELTIPEWSELSGNSKGLIDWRLRKGWEPERAIFQPVIKEKRSMRHRKDKNRITEKDVLEMRQMKKYWGKIRHLSAKFGVAEPTISNIVNNITWKNVSVK